MLCNCGGITALCAAEVNKHVVIVPGAFESLFL